MEHHDGLAYRFEDGDGRPLVFLHGWLGSHHDWDPVRSGLETERPVLVYDHRCHGESDCQRFDLDDLAKDLHGLLNHLDLDAPVFAGHSLGGTTALRYAMRHPVSGLFLCGAFATEPEPEHRSPRAFLELLDTMDREQWAQEIAANYSPEGSRARELAAQELMEADETPIRCGLELMTGLDLRDELREIRVPARIISGTDDAAVTPEKGKELVKALEGDLYELEATHLMLRERSGTVAGLLEEFMRSL